MRRLLWIPTVVCLALVGCGDDTDDPAAEEPTMAVDDAAVDDAAAAGGVVPEPSTEEPTAVPTPTVTPTPTVAPTPSPTVYAAEVVLDAEMANQVAVGPDGTVWATTSSGLQGPWELRQYDGEGWVVVASASAPETPASLGDPPPFAGVAPDGDLFVFNPGVNPSWPNEIWEYAAGGWSDRTGEIRHGPNTFLGGMVVGPDGVVWTLTTNERGEPAVHQYTEATQETAAVPVEAQGAYGIIGPLAGAPDGTLWFGTDAGDMGEAAVMNLGHFDGTEWTVHSRDPLTTAEDEELITRIVTGDDGVVWLLVTPSGGETAWWQHYREGAWTTIAIDPMASEVDEDCVAQVGGAGLFDLDDPAARVGVMDRAIQGLDVAPDGALWVVTVCTGVTRVDPSDGTITAYGTEDGLPSLLVSGLAVADDGSAWVAGEGGVTRIADIS